MKTITVKGKVYEIGKLYLCNESDRFGFIESVRNRSYFHMKNNSAQWHSENIKMVEPELIGTIKDAPIEVKKR